MRIVAYVSRRNDFVFCLHAIQIIREVSSCRLDQCNCLEVRRTSVSNESTAESMKNAEFILNKQQDSLFLGYSLLSAEPASEKVQSAELL